MKNLMSLLAILVVFGFYACKDNSESSADNMDEVKEMTNEDMMEGEMESEDNMDASTSEEFSKSLGREGYFNDITFEVTSGTNENNGKIVTIVPNGYTASNSELIFEYDGTIKDAEMDDLNGDNYPEVLVYINGADGKNTILGGSSNGGNSMSGFYFPPTSDNAEINEGYNGEDEFTIIEGRLAQRFPIYEGDTKTGKMRQVIYKLENGEAGRILRVDSVSEF